MATANLVIFLRSMGLFHEFAKVPAKKESKKESIMNNDMRLSIWTDETAHPGSPTTRAAMEASGANMSLCDDWYDLEGQSEEPMCYLDFLKGAIGIAEDHDPKHEFDTPAAHISRKTHLVQLWIELEKAVRDMPHNALGENKTEYDNYVAAEKMREEAKAAHEKAQSMLLPPKTYSIRIPGSLHARYDAVNNCVLGFSFTPADDYNSVSVFARAVHTYLHNVNEISGEPAMHVVWEEEGWTS